MTNDFSLIVPIASDREEYQFQIPQVFQLSKDGLSYCVKSILNLDLTLFSAIYFTILESLEKKYSISDLLKLQFKRIGLKNAKIIILKKTTKSQPETVYETIRQAGIKGAIFIKDADCGFSAEISRQNSIAIYPLEQLKWVNPQNKSYVAVDDMFYVTNIIEKRIISHYFSAGGYCFEDSDVFCKFYKKYQDKNGLYLSHIIYAMLLEKIIFRPIITKDYIDYETTNT